MASIFILAAAWAFYGAALSAPVYFIAGLVGSSIPLLGIQVQALLGIPTGLLILGLTIWFWISVLRGVLQLKVESIVLISVCAFGALLALVFLIMFLLIPWLS